MCDILIAEDNESLREIMREVLSGHMRYYQHNFTSGTHFLTISHAGGYQETPEKLHLQFQ